jgi:putative heme-binding domain-containing protein
VGAASFTYWSILLILLWAIHPVAAQRGGRGVAPVVQPPPPQGSAANGKALVESQGCLRCHRIDGSGSRVGPDLSMVGAVRSPDQLSQDLTAPDAEVAPTHRSVRVVGKDGTTVTGHLLNHDAFSVQLMDEHEQLRSFLRSDLRELTILQKGLMPAYGDKLTPQQINDLVNYLASLKGGRS